jgi:D-lactate dehydrogenase (cytochrome)
MPLRRLPRGSIALRSAQPSAIWRQCGASARLTGGAQRRWASDDKRTSKDEERPFYLQLNESIFERVQKEKAEQIKIQSLQQRTARGQFFATVVGTKPSLVFWTLGLH